MKKNKKLFFTLIIAMVLFCIDVKPVYSAVQWITITGTEFVIDSLHGVDAIYTEENNAPEDAVYSCAAYVKKYYKKVYGVTVTNLMDNGPPMIPDGKAALKQVTEPQAGDIIFWPTSSNANNHSAIVKSVEGNTVTLIEQNYKSGVTAALNRSVEYPSSKFQFWRISDSTIKPDTSDSSKQETPIQKEQSKKGTEENPKEIVFNEESIATLCEPYEKDVIVDVTGKKGSMNIKTKKRTYYQSYFFDGKGEYYCFIIDEKSDIDSWYLNSAGRWRETEKGELITTERAYFTIEKPEELSLPSEDIDTTTKEPPIILPADDKDVILPPSIEETDSLPIDTIEEPEKNREPVKEILFSDLNESHWAYQSIINCVSKGLFAGYEDGTFQPDKKITRAEFAVLICKAMEIDVSTMTGESCVDVKKEDWYSPYIEFARYILEGETRADGSIVFRPNELAKREDISSAVVNMNNLDSAKADLTILENFTDKNTISYQKRATVALAVEKGFMNGFEDNTFQGQQAITRAQAAVIFDKMK